VSRAEDGIEKQELTLRNKRCQFHQNLAHFSGRSPRAASGIRGHRGRHGVGAHLEASFPLVLESLNREKAN